MPAPFADPAQLAFPGLTPNVGDRWRNRHTGTIAVVLKPETRHYNWVTIWVDEREQIIAVANFLRTFELL